jgi:hypothetical protein
MSRDHRGLIDDQLSESNGCPIEVPPCRQHSIEGARPLGKMIAFGTGLPPRVRWGLQMMNECSNAGFQTRMREAVTSNKTTLPDHINIDASFFALVREIEEKLLLTDTTRSIGKANGLPRSYAAGRV